jgi:hypothetical protein
MGAINAIDNAPLPDSGKEPVAVDDINGNDGSEENTLEPGEMPDLRLYPFYNYFGVRDIRNGAVLSESSRYGINFLYGLTSPDKNGKHKVSAEGVDAYLRFIKILGTGNAAYAKKTLAADKKLLSTLGIKPSDVSSLIGDLVLTVKTYNPYTDDSKRTYTYYDETGKLSAGEKFVAISRVVTVKGIKYYIPIMALPNPATVAKAFGSGADPTVEYMAFLAKLQKDKEYALPTDFKARLEGGSDARTYDGILTSTPIRTFRFAPADPKTKLSELAGRGIIVDENIYVLGGDDSSTCKGPKWFKEQLAHSLGIDPNDTDFSKKFDSVCYNRDGKFIYAGMPCAVLRFAEGGPSRPVILKPRSRDFRTMLD